MHRAYQPLKPVTNRYLQQRWDEDQFNQHRKKVSSALPTVDTRGMDIPVHVQLKLKKLQLQDEKLSAIDRDNRILASKLSDIVRSKGVVDHRNHYQIRSLNREKRRDEMLQVCVQNQAIYHRISARQSEYRRCVWLEEWERTERRRDDIARYPRKNKRGRRRVQFAASESEEQSEATTDLSDSASTTTTTTSSEEKDTQRDE